MSVMKSRRFIGLPRGRLTGPESRRARAAPLTESIAHLDKQETADPSMILNRSCSGGAAKSSTASVKLGIQRFRLNVGFSSIAAIYFRSPRKCCILGHGCPERMRHSSEWAVEIFPGQQHLNI